MTVFVSGSGSVTELDDNVIQRLEKMCGNGLMILLGNKEGAERCFREYFSSVNYKDVEIFSIAGDNKENIGDWALNEVTPPNKPVGFGYYAERDMKMIEKCDYGFMIWDGKSKDVLLNSVCLAEKKKTNVIYLHKNGRFVTVSSEETLERLILQCDKKVQAMYENMNNPFMRKCLF